MIKYYKVPEIFDIAVEKFSVYWYGDKFKKKTQGTEAHRERKIGTYSTDYLPSVWLKLIE